VEKNRLAAADAQRVEEAFQARLATLATDAAEIVQQTPAESGQLLTAYRPDSDATEKRPRSKVIDKSVLAVPEPRRVRDRNHVKSVAKQACLLCGRRPSDAHHLRFAQHAALGRKVSDEFTVPLCRGHHREVHRCGDEAAWWRTAGVDPTVNARTLWLASHPLLVTDEGGVESAALDRRSFRTLQHAPSGKADVGLGVEHKKAPHTVGLGRRQ